jgi:hypothetical protein
MFLNVLFKGLISFDASKFILEKVYDKKILKISDLTSLMTFFELYAT